MKRKMTALLTVVLMLAMLAGCGNSSQTATSGGGKKAEVLSECLSTEKVIAYEVDTVDKSETPDNIYFFENGKVTIIPGKEFGLTMGDFAQMTDKEIWSTYETVRETYSEKYVSEKLESAKSSIEGKIQSAEDDLEYVTSMKESFESGLNGEADDLDYLCDIMLEELGEAGQNIFSLYADTYNAELECKTRFIFCRPEKQFSCCVGKSYSTRQYRRHDRRNYGFT